MTVLVGGVSQLYQGDHDFGRVVVARLQDEDLGHHVLVEDLYYGAVAVVQRLQEVRPDALVLVGAHERGRRPGTVERRLIEDFSPLPPDRIQKSVEDAVTGYVNLDIAVDVVVGLDAAPARMVVIEVEPARTQPAEELSDEAQRAVDEVVTLVRREVERAPLFELVNRLRETLEEHRLEPSPALDLLERLLAQLQDVDRSGSWGSTFSLRDRLKFAIASGETGEGMSHLDWGLWWALIEELERLQSAEGTSGS